MTKQRNLPGAPMTLGNMRHLGVQHLIATCLSDACRHQGLIDGSKYPDDTAVPWFASKVVCAKCGARDRHIDVRPNWKEQPPKPSLPGWLAEQFMKSDTGSRMNIVLGIVGAVIASAIFSVFGIALGGWIGYLI